MAVILSTLLLVSCCVRNIDFSFCNFVNITPTTTYIHPPPRPWLVLVFIASVSLCSRVALPGAGAGLDTTRHDTERQEKTS